MDTNKAVLALVLMCSLIQIASLGKPQPIQTETGGGDCIDNDDCANNGICRVEPKSKEKGKCNCFVGFTKPNCDGESKVKTLDPGVKGKPVRRNHIHRHEGASKRFETGSESYERAETNEETGSERSLEYDPKSDIFGLTPKNLADTGQEFLIYNPDKKVFLFVSKDLKATGKHMPYVEAREDRDGLRNIFTFMKVPGQNGKYYIKNKDTDKFLYVSNSKSGFIHYWNNNVLAADSVATDASKIKFIFDFEDEDGDGFYKIKNQGKSFYVSSHMLGIPMYRLVKATDQKELERWHSQFFQFVLKDKPRDVKFATKGEPKKKPQTVIDAGQNSKSCNQGKSKTDKEDDVQIQYKETKTETRTYTQTQGFTFNGKLPDPYGGMSFTYSNTQATQDANTKTTELTRTVGIKVPVNRCACITISYKAVDYDQEFEVTATSKEGKVLKATGQVKGTSRGEFEVHKAMFDYKNDFKCPYEK